MKTLKKIVITFLILLLVFWGLVWVADKISLQKGLSSNQVIQGKILKEESVVIEVVEKYGPSVVTVGIKKTEKYINPYEYFFNPFGNPRTQERKIEQDIGSGFVVSEDGLIVTNKHVVSDTSAQYRVFSVNDKQYEVKKIFRDPSNDLAILKIDVAKGELGPIELGDSGNLKVGQFVVAIGTALGQFRNTVTTGVISGLGRGIVAGNPFEGYAENLDDVIQTDAAINPGNSGGPLLNSLGQVIGINVAEASGAENIAFALPINLVKEMLKDFNESGQFSRPFLGIRYEIIEKKQAIASGWPEGAGVVEVVENSPAAIAGIQEGDIITKVDGEKINKDNNLAKVISHKKVGQTIKVTVWREEKEETVSITLLEFSY